MLEIIQKNYGWILALLALAGFWFRTWMKANPQDAERYSKLDQRLAAVENGLHEMEKSIVGIKQQIEALPNAKEFREHSNQLSAISRDISHLSEGLKGLSDLIHDFVQREQTGNGR